MTGVIVVTPKVWADANVAHTAIMAKLEREHWLKLEREKDPLWKRHKKPSPRKSLLSVSSCNAFFKRIAGRI